ncbi:MAG: pantetheine-phosphate adenylyltransferase [Bacilli bacterium]|jgi:pantetheine-phosphate adenylyltransferase|nr:pantetheine-phosphate adenylyltransferase [Bacilli bacterium]MBQ4182475.1 pantetheine-phosphate adenylyltransferase [Bacilli bacterium]
MKIAVYPGSFDPITNGHLDILKRSLKIFDKVILLLAVNPKKKSRFSVEERLEMMRGAVKDYPNVEVDFFDGLTVKYAKEHGAKALIRGLRAVTDFEYEFQLSAGNAYVDPSIEMVFFMAGKEMSFISSSMVNELEESGVDVSDLVPPSVIEAYKKSK